MAQEGVIHAYRQLYRAALKAVCYSQPASTVARDQLRRAFRDKTSTFNQNAIRRTVWFLNNAARERGTEHKIVKNLVFTQWCRESNSRVSWRYISSHNKPHQRKECVACPSELCPASRWGKLAVLTGTCSDLIKDKAYAHYDQTIAMLNKTMGLCLPLR
ncbi:hypothetical protein diail_7547 [Diaporthe ilicicola]|nr:hypothetical protein diail_7547 [Diaporthe ilicicola]